MAPAVLSAGPEGVGATGTVANALYAAEAELRAAWPRMLSSVRQLAGADGGGRLVFALHPAGGPVELRLDAEGGATMSGATGLAGPGYHRFLGAVARRLGRAISADWAVPDPGEELERAFLSWLGRRAEAALVASLADTDPDDTTLHWLPELLPGTGRFQGEGAVATTTGPRGEPWLQAVAAEPRAGIDAFPWWSAGLGDDYRIGRARVLLWRELRWRAPSTGDELAVLSEISNLLAEAWDHDPSRDDLPWAAWHEVLSLLGEAEERRARVRARARPGPAIGYRRHLVGEALPGGWTLDLPGRMGVSWSEDEGWCAWEERRTAWFTPLQGDTREPPAPDGELLETLRRPEGTAWIVRSRDEEGETIELLSGWVRAGGQLGLLTLAWLDGAAGRAVAESCWRSLRRAD